MKLAVSTLGCPKWDIREIAETLCKIGVEGLEIRGIQGVMRTEEIPCLKRKNWKDTKRLLDDNGVKVFCLGTSVRFHDAENYSAMLDEGKKAIDTAAFIGAGAIRVFGDQLTGEPETDNEIFERVIRGYRELCAYAKDTGVRVCQETHGSFNTLEAIGRILEGMQDVPEFGYIWDVMHTYRAYGRPFEAAYELLKPRINHLHVKDCTKEHKLVPCGEGDVPLGEIVSALKMDGYEGYLSLEWEKVWHPYLADAEEVFPSFAKYFAELIAR